MIDLLERLEKARELKPLTKSEVEQLYKDINNQRREFGNYCSGEWIFQKGMEFQHAKDKALIKALRVAVTALSEIREYSLGSKADICDGAQAKIFKILRGDEE